MISVDERPYFGSTCFLIYMHKTSNFCIRFEETIILTHQFQVTSMMAYHVALRYCIVSIFYLNHRQLVLKSVERTGGTLGCVLLLTNTQGVLCSATVVPIKWQPINFILRLRFSHRQFRVLVYLR